MLSGGASSRWKPWHRHKFARLNLLKRIAKNFQFKTVMTRHWIDIKVKQKRYKRSLLSTLRITRVMKVLLRCQSMIEHSRDRRRRRRSLHRVYSWAMDNIRALEKLFRRMHLLQVWSKFNLKISRMNRLMSSKRTPLFWWHQINKWVLPIPILQTKALKTKSQYNRVCCKTLL